MGWGLVSFIVGNERKPGMVKLVCLQCGAVGWVYPPPGVAEPRKYNTPLDRLQLGAILYIKTNQRRLKAYSMTTTEKGNQ